jgi:hypothetical protein
MSNGFSIIAGRVCPVCGKKIKRKDSYSQPGDGHEIYHFHCYYAEQAISQRPETRPERKTTTGGKA